jgi:small subunit ribosomal protein S4
LVTHRHVTVNGEVVNVPSYSLRGGDVVAVREKSKSLESITNSLGSGSKKFDWLDWNGSSMSGKVISIPARDMIPENIKEQLIVELYSK